VAVVVASKGYPEQPDTGIRVTVPAYAGSNMVFDQTIIFYGAVTREGDDIRTSGGRCFTVVGVGTNILEANTAAYSVVPDISFEGAWFRNDIGNRFFDE